jgi:hypothetical protein
MVKINSQKLTNYYRQSIELMAIIKAKTTITHYTTNLKFIKI